MAINLFTITHTNHRMAAKLRPHRMAFVAACVKVICSTAHAEFDPLIATPISQTMQTVSVVFVLLSM
jgi:hypothetical protein